MAWERPIIIFSDDTMPIKITRKAMLGQKIAIFGDSISETGRKMSNWSWGKSNKVPKTYLDDTGITSPDAPSPWVKTGCEAQTGSFKRFGCEKPEDMSWKDFLEQKETER
jgi:hypothetical protein